MGSFILGFGQLAPAAGIFNDGVTARSEALGGAAVTGNDSAIDALASNPAALSRISHIRMELSGELTGVDGEFHNRANDSADLHDWGMMGAGAIAGTWGPVSVGLGVIPDSTLRADWRYKDTPGGLGGLTSYGERSHLSEIALIRFALGVSYAITPEISVGASLGLLYNHNRLQSPYIIQTQPQIAGAKTLLDLETEGWGWNAQFGILWQPTDKISVGISYTLPTKLKTDGHATSNAELQLSDLGVTDVDGTTDFDAEVTNAFPQILSGGISWQACSKVKLLAEVDWINWSAAFDTLEVRLRHTHNELYQTLLGGKSNLDDDVPLQWRDQWVFRLGAEYALTEEFTLRVGYRYARSQVRDEYLTPLTAAVPEHVVAAGLGYRKGAWSCDLAYQWHIPQHEHIGRSRLQAGEYRDSDIDVAIHRVALTVGYEF